MDNENCKICGNHGIIKDAEWYCKDCYHYTTKEKIGKNIIIFKKRLEYERLWERLSEKKK